MSIADRLEEDGYEDVVLFSNPSYETAFIGVSETDRAIYDYNLMVDWLVSNEGMTGEEAQDFICYNTIRALPYIKNAPIVLFKAGLEE